MEITFLRHAQSIFNRDLISEKDCSLTELGLCQARGIVGDYDIIICSILKRTRETLDYSELTGKKIYYTHLCREMKVDICDFLEEEDETLLETEEELERRINEFKIYIKKIRQPGQTVLVVCHRDFIHHFGKKQYPEPKNVEFQTIQFE